MRYFTTILFCSMIGVGLAFSATDAELKANDKAYGEAKAVFDGHLKEDRLEDAFEAARVLLECAELPGSDSGAWRGVAPTYTHLLKGFSDKNIFGCDYAQSLYEEAIGKLEGHAKARVLVQYGMYLDRLALADEKTAQSYIDSAFEIAGLKERQLIGLCRLAAQLNPGSVDLYADRALGFADGSPELQALVLQWRLSTDARSKVAEELYESYETAIESAELKDFIFARNNIFEDYVRELIRRKDFGRALMMFDRIPSDLAPEAMIAFLKHKAVAQRGAAERYFEKPSPEGLRRAIDTYRAIISLLPSDRLNEIVSMEVAIAEVAWEAGDCELARTDAEAVLAKVDRGKDRHVPTLLYILGRLDYDADRYAEAAVFFKEAHGHASRLPKNYSYRRPLVEHLLRSYCALGAFDEALEYGDELLGLVARYEKGRYEQYLDGLRERVADQRK